MDIDLLRTFLEVRRLGNFRSAAENLHVTQAAVSQRVKHLESILNASLFVREKNNITPTQAGEQLVPVAESIVAAWVQVQQDIGRPETLGASLSAAAAAGVWELAGYMCLEWFRRRAPDTSYKADILGEDLIRKRLVQQTLDLGFLIFPTDLDGLNCDPVMSFELALHSARAKTVEQAAGEPYIYVEWGLDVAAISKAELGASSQPLLRTGDYLIGQRFAEQNGGAVFLPVGLAGAKSKLREVPGSPRIRRHVYAAWHKKNPQRGLIDDVIGGLAAPQAD